MPAGYQADLECSRVAKQTVLRQFSKAILGAGTDIKLNENAAEAPARVAFLVLEMASADPL